MSEPVSPSGSTNRLAQLIGIAVVLAAVAIGVYTIGVTTGQTILRFAGLMVGATTFVPLPADTFVLQASADNPALAIGLVGGLINGVVVLIERRWILILVDYPWFDRFRSFFDANRVVAWTERNMFVSLLVGGASFIPFEPFRLIAVVRNYSPIKYFIATCLARGGRYYVLASVGAALLEVGFLQQAIWLTLGLFFFGLWRSALKLIRGAAEQDEADQHQAEQAGTGQAGTGQADADQADADQDQQRGEREA